RVARRLVRSQPRAGGLVRPARSRSCARAQAQARRIGRESRRRRGARPRRVGCVEPGGRKRLPIDVACVVRKWRHVRCAVCHRRVCRRGLFAATAGVPGSRVRGVEYREGLSVDCGERHRGGQTMTRRALCVVLLCFALPAFAAPLTLLTASEVSALVKPAARGERIIALWALDCAYCEPNLAALAKLQ